MGAGLGLHKSVYDEAEQQPFIRAVYELIHDRLNGELLR
jgi:hypothetical protein